MVCNFCNLSTLRLHCLPYYWMHFDLDRTECWKNLDVTASPSVWELGQQFSEKSRNNFRAEKSEFQSFLPPHHSVRNKPKRTPCCARVAKPWRSAPSLVAHRLVYRPQFRTRRVAWRSAGRWNRPTGCSTTGPRRSALNTPSTSPGASSAKRNTSTTGRTSSASRPRRATTEPKMRPCE